MRAMRRVGFTKFDLLVVIGVAFVLLALVAILIPTKVISTGSAGATCGANLTGIAKALNLYAASNADRFPVVMPPAVLGHYNNKPTPSTPSASDPSMTLASYYAAPYPQAGDPSACLWALVLSGNVSPKQFICKSDPSAPTISDQTDTRGKYYNNFGVAVGPDNGISYSFAYPWARKPDRTVGVGRWWTATVDSSIPIGADMAPLSGVGGKDTTQAKGAGDRKTYNSANHGGLGFNVVFADTHVEFVTNPYVGQGGDNIWTLGSGASQVPITTPGITPVPAYVAPLGTPPTYSVPSEPDGAIMDIIMVPVRDAATGKL